MFFNRTMAEFVNFCHQTVKEITVMTDNDQRPVKMNQCLFEDILCFQIQMIGKNFVF